MHCLSEVLAALQLHSAVTWPLGRQDFILRKPNQSGLEPGQCNKEQKRERSVLSVFPLTLGVTEMSYIGDRFLANVSHRHISLYLTSSPKGVS